MTRLVLAALAGFLALGLVGGVATAQAAPPRSVHCTGAGSVWDDTDIVHLTKEGAGTLVLSWSAKGHTSLTCTDGTSTTTQPAQIDQRVHVRVLADGSVRGSGQTRVRAGNLHHSFSGHFIGTATLSAGTLSLAGDFNSDGDVDGADYALWRMHMSEGGTVNLATKQASGFYIDDIIIGAKARS